MSSVPSELTGLGFWLALAAVAIAIVWAHIRRQQMKHELTLKLLEKGRDVDTDLLAKVLAPPSIPVRSAIDHNRDGGGFTGLIFVISGLVIAFVSMLRPAGMSWPLLGLGAFTFLFGNWIWRQTMKEYVARKELEKDLPRN